MRIRRHIGSPVSSVFIVCMVFFDIMTIHTDDRLLSRVEESASG